jgi:hypothetical protein
VQYFLTIGISYHDIRNKLLFPTRQPGMVQHFRHHASRYSKIVSDRWLFMRHGPNWINISDVVTVAVVLEG